MDLEYQDQEMGDSIVGSDRRRDAWGLGKPNEAWLAWGGCRA
jgi:hypothetical protein